MADLKGTYDKFLHENAMCAEDIRSTARETYEKWQHQNEVIARLENFIEKNRITKIMEDTATRKKNENYESCNQDYEMKVR